jgi:single-strand DNA-binding protein
MFHQITAIGRLGRDAELRYTPNGKAVCSFSVATDDGYGDNKKTVWIKCSLWNERAEKLSQYLTKGQVVFVEGRFSSDDAGECKTWTDQKGKVHASYEIMVNEIKLLPGGPKRGEGEGDPVEQGQPVHPNVAQVQAQAEVPF